MSGLIYKDIYTLFKQYKYLMVIMVLCALLPGGSPIALSLMYAAILPVSAIALDDQTGWNKLAAALPVARWQVVASKYLLGLMCSGLVFVLGAVGDAAVSLIKGAGYDVGHLATFLGYTSIGLAMQALSMPLMFKWGAEKGRMVMMFVMALGVGAIISLNLSLPGGLAQLMTNPLVWFAIAAVAYVVSMLICARIFEKREL